MSDPFNLKRFVDAQLAVIDRALDEIRSGRKQSHWMWFVFPQIAGLGHSPTARFYALASVDEARAYFDHPLLGPRLIEATALADALTERSATRVFGSPDDLKIRSSLTLFAAAASDPAPFRKALAHFFGGVPDKATLDLIERGTHASS